MRRLSGRALLVPHADELVAMGAAAQAAGVLLGEPPEAVTRGWNASAGVELPPLARDEAALERHALRPDRSRAARRS